MRIDQKGSLIFSTIVSLGIMAMFLGLSVPYFRAYQTNTKLSGAARDLTSDLRWAQQRTIAEQVIYKAQLNRSANSYSILKIEASTTTIKTVSLPDEVVFYSIDPNLEDAVIFNFFGAVSQSGSIILNNSLEKTASINVKPSGYIELSL